MKKVFSLFLALVLCLSLCACGENGSEQTTVNTDSVVSSVSLTYTVNDDGTYTVTGTGNCFDKDLCIPESYKESSVTTIGYGAFSDCDWCKSITLPDSINIIDDWAFRNSAGLMKITISNGVTNIGLEAFAYCTGLNEIILPDSISIIGGSAFEGCTGLTNIHIPENVTKIEHRLFAGCTGLTSVTIPDGVTSLGVNVFDGCVGLTEIFIPDSVTSVEVETFEGCTNLTTIHFAGTQEQWDTLADQMDWENKAIEIDVIIGKGGGSVDINPEETPDGTVSNDPPEEIIGGDASTDGTNEEVQSDDPYAFLYGHWCTYNNSLRFDLFKDGKGADVWEQETEWTLTDDVLVIELKQDAHPGSVSGTFRVVQANGTCYLVGKTITYVREDAVSIIPVTQVELTADNWQEYMEIVEVTGKNGSSLYLSVKDSYRYIRSGEILFCYMDAREKEISIREGEYRTPIGINNMEGFELVKVEGTIGLLDGI